MRRSIALFLLLLAAVLLAAAPSLAQRSSAEAEVAFTYGVRAFNRGEWNEAVRLFREALAADPDNADTRSWLDLALARQRGEAVASPGFGGLLALRDQPRFDFRAGGAYGTDSNPAQLSDDAVVFGTGGGTLRGEVDDRVTDFDLRAAAYPFYGRGSQDPRSGWSLGLTGQVKAARFQDLDFLNERQWSAAVQLAWGSDPLGYLTGPLGYTRVPFGHSRFSLLLQAGRTDTRLDGKPLLTSDEAALAFVFREGVITATQIELAAAKERFYDGFTDGDSWTAGASQLLFLGRRDRYLRFGATRGELTDGLLGDVSSQAGIAELTLPMADSLALQLTASRRKDEREFDLLSPSFNFDVTTTRVAAALSWKVVHRLYLVGRAAWTESDTDGATIFLFSPLTVLSDYQRTTASVGIQWLW